MEKISLVLTVLLYIGIFVLLIGTIYTYFRNMYNLKYFRNMYNIKYSKRSNLKKKKSVKINNTSQQFNDKSNKNKKQIINKDDLLKEIENSRKFNKKFKYIAYFLAMLISILGTILLFLGIIISFYNSMQLGWLTVSSGLIVELISVVYFWLVSKTTKEVEKDNDQLMREIDILLANELIDEIQDDKIRDETYAKIIESLIIKK